MVIDAVRRLFLSLVFVFSFVLFIPSNVLAATISYLITEGVVAYQISTRGEVFYEKNLIIEYKSGKIIFSSNPDGTGQTFADDAIVMTITKRGGGTMKFEHHYEKNCQALDPAPPKDITNYFPGEGTYDINVKLKDVCYYYVAANPMYLVNINAPEPSVSPTPTPPEPFLDLPWNYDCKQAIDEELNKICDCRHIPDDEEHEEDKNKCESKKRILKFDVALLSIKSWFDHEYPLQNYGSDIKSVRTYTGIVKNLYYKSHSGYDYASQVGIKLNTPVLAAASGWATFDNTCGACGNMIKITHDNGYQTWYEHLDSNGLIVNTVGEKTRVVKGQKIGEVGMTGKTTGPHIHFSVFKDANNNGNFNDDYPYGLTDPLGWEGSYDDPWTKYTKDPPSIENKNYGVSSSNLYVKRTMPEITQIPKSGGRLTSIDGDTTIDVPQNATPSAFTLTHKKGPFESFEKGGKTIESIVPSFFLDAVNAGGEKITQFSEAFKIIVRYEPLNILFVKQNTLAAYYFNEILNEWTPLPTIVDEVNRTVTFYTNHNSQFAVMGEAIDKIPPTTEIVINGVKGAENWYRTDVLIDLFGQDNEGGLGLEYTLFTLDGSNWNIFENTISLIDEGEHILQYQSFDKAGNEGERYTAIIKIDKTAPLVNANTDRNADQDGWYNNPVIISFSGEDNSSGIDICTEPVNYAGQDNNSAIVEGNCRDKAGNVAYVSFEFKYDSTAPTLTAYASIDSGEYISGTFANTDVKIEFNCTDEVSGVETVTDPITLATEGKNQSAAGECVDNAGNNAEIEFGGINIDMTPPVVSIQAAPDSIWPPNGKLVEVNIIGNSSDENLDMTTFQVIDEYGQIQPPIYDFNQIIQLEAKRDGADKDGRKYTIKVFAEDMAGNISKAEAIVVVPHDKGK